jgi:hypothetical protein
VERPASRESLTPTDLANRLQRLHEKLPEPPLPDVFGDKQVGEAWSLTADIWSACHAYEQALRAMTAPSSSLDDRLRAIYGRLHVQAIKIAILLAALDWADDEQAPPRPKVTAAHWYRAQGIVEEWRASAHRLLADLGENEEGRLENRVLGLLKVCGGSATVRDLYRALRAPRKTVLETLKALEEDGRVMRVQHAYNGRGRPPEKYELIDADSVTAVT